MQRLTQKKNLRPPYSILVNLLLWDPSIKRQKKDAKLLWPLLTDQLSILKWNNGKYESLSNHIFSTIFEFFFGLVLFFMILKKLSTFKFFLRIATFFKKSQSLKNKHVRSLIHLSLVAQLISFFYLKKGNLLLVYGIS